MFDKKPICTYKEWLNIRWRQKAWRTITKATMKVKWISIEMKRNSEWHYIKTSDGISWSKRFSEEPNTEHNHKTRHKRRYLRSSVYPYVPREDSRAPRRTDRYQRQLFRLFLIEVFKKYIYLEEKKVCALKKAHYKSWLNFFSFSILRCCWIRLLLLLYICNSHIGI